MTIYTIGHSNKTAELFLDTIRAYGIDRVIDVRTKPYSRWCPQFNQQTLAYFLAAFDINYDWRGSSLGGLAENVCYDEAIDWVVGRSNAESIVLMCSEADHKKCHRFTMLTPDIELRGGSVSHISYENERDVTTDLLRLL